MSASTVPLVTKEAVDISTREPSTSHPFYDCPKCGERAMQFFRILPEESHFSERTNVFVCSKCGRSWEM